MEHPIGSFAKQDCPHPKTSLFFKNKPQLSSPFNRLIPPNPIHMWNNGPHCEELTELGKAVTSTGCFLWGRTRTVFRDYSKSREILGRVAGHFLSSTSPQASLWGWLRLLGECHGSVLTSLPSSGSATRWGHVLTVPTSLQLAKYWEAFLPEAKAIS